MIGAGNDKQVSHALVEGPCVFTDQSFTCSTSLTAPHICTATCHLLQPQFRILTEKVLELSHVTTDPKFSTNEARVKNRTELIDMITNRLMMEDRDFWLERFTGVGYVPFSASAFTSNDASQSPFWPDQ